MELYISTYFSYRTAGVSFVQLKLPFFFKTIVTLILKCFLKFERVANDEINSLQVHVSRKPWEHVLLDSAPGDLRHRCSYSISKDMSRKVHIIYPLFWDNTV
jgi:hypothetical protein